MQKHNPTEEVGSEESVIRSYSRRRCEGEEFASAQFQGFLQLLYLPILVNLKICLYFYP